MSEWNFDFTGAPEDEKILLATVGEWVDTAFFVVNEDTGEREWFWGDRTPIHGNLMPLAWMLLPKHPSVPSALSRALSDRG